MELINHNMAMYLDTSFVFFDMHPMFSCLHSTHLEKTQLPIDADFVEEGCIILNKVAKPQLEGTTLTFTHIHSTSRG